MKASLDFAEKYKKAIFSETVYNVQFSAYGNILLLPQTTVSDLEKARIDTLNARSAIDSKLKDISDKTGPFSLMLNQTREQLALNEKQLADISATNPVDRVTGTLKKNLQTLIALLTAKQKRIEKILDIYQSLRMQLEETRTALSDLSEKLNRQIALKKKEALFQRSTSPLLALNVTQIESEISAIFNKTWKLFTDDFRTLCTRSFWESAGHRLLSALVFYTGILWGMLRVRRFCRSYVTERQAGQDALATSCFQHAGKILDSCRNDCIHCRIHEPSARIGRNCKVENRSGFSVVLAV